MCDGRDLQHIALALRETFAVGNVPRIAPDTEKVVDVMQISLRVIGHIPCDFFDCFHP